MRSLNIFNSIGSAIPMILAISLLVPSGIEPSGLGLRFPNSNAASPDSRHRSRLHLQQNDVRKGIRLTRASPPRRSGDDVEGRIRGKKSGSLSEQTKSARRNKTCKVAQASSREENIFEIRKRERKDSKISESKIETGTLQETLAQLSSMIKQNKCHAVAFGSDTLAPVCRIRETQSDGKTYFVPVFDQKSFSEKKYDSRVEAQKFLKPFLDSGVCKNDHTSTQSTKKGNRGRKPHLGRSTARGHLGKPAPRTEVLRNQEDEKLEKFLSAQEID